MLRAPPHGAPPNQRPPLLVNPEFDLSAELAARHYRVSSVDRISLMLRRYREGRTPAIMENKLLAHSLLRSIGAPVARQIPVRTDCGAWRRRRVVPTGR